MRLGDEYYEPLLEILRQHRVGLAVNRHGNAGDQLIQQATIELFERSGIAWRLLAQAEIENCRLGRDITLIAEPGGGNLGAHFRGSPRRRQLLGGLKLPKVILPQTAHDADEDLAAWDTVFVREHTSYEMLRAVHRDVRHLPDMALNYRAKSAAPAKIAEGVFLRSDWDQTEPGTDPAKACATWQEYLRMAAHHGTVITNRLHFGIAALLQDRRAVFLPTSYHKMRSVYESWLRRFPLASWMDHP